VEQIRREMYLTRKNVLCVICSPSSNFEKNFINNFLEKYNDHDDILNESEYYQSRKIFELNGNKYIQKQWFNLDVYTGLEYENLLNNINEIVKKDLINDFYIYFIEIKLKTKKIVLDMVETLKKIICDQSSQEDFYQTEFKKVTNDEVYEKMFDILADDFNKRIVNKKILEHIILS